MAKVRTDYARGIKPMPTPQGAEVIAVRMEATLTAALTTADQIEFGELPEDCVPVDWAIDNEALDTSTNLIMSIGLLDTTGTAISTGTNDGSAAWLATSTAFRAAGFTRNAAAAAQRVRPLSNSRRKIGAVVTAGPGTSTTGKIAMVLTYRAAYGGSGAA